MAFDAVADIYPGTGDPNAPHPDTFGPLGEIDGKRCVGIIWHTTEYGTQDNSRETALRVADDQAHGQLGSYNWIIYDGGLLLCVPYLEASGGINPASAYWHPKPELKQLLGKAYADPARYMLQVAFQGDTATAASWPPNMIETAANLTLWIESQEWSADVLVHVGHMDFQTNRSDPSPAVLDAIRRRRDLILAAQTPQVPVFTDVQPGDTHYAGIKWAKEQGIALPLADGSFKPNSAVTRGQLMTFLHRANKDA